MLRRFFASVVWTVLVLAFAGVAEAQPAPKPAQPQAKPHRFLMWKATSPVSTLYLVGSIHLGDKSMYPLPSEVESAFAAAKVLVVEINLKKVDPAKTMASVMQYGMYYGDDSLSRHIPRETSDALDSYCAQHNFPRTRVEQLKPWMAAVTVAALAWQDAGEEPSFGIDMHFLNESKPPQRIEEIETSESQLSLFVNATEEEQLSLLSTTLKQGDKIKDIVKRIQAAYLSGDPAELKRTMDEQSDTGSKSLTKKLIDDRNFTMAARLEEYLKNKEKAFVVVGAAHIVGDNGIAQLLRNKGYKVEQVTLAGKTE